MPEGPVVVDNTPLVAFWTLRRLGLLQDLFGEVLVPPAVYDEFVALHREKRTRSLASATWIRVEPLAEPLHASLYLGLDRGEAEVLALAEEQGARLVIMDERRGRRFAQSLGLPLTGTLGVLLLGKEQALIKSVAAEIGRLQAAGMYLGPALVARAKNLAGE